MSLDDLPDLGLEAHVKHAVSLVEHHGSDGFHGNNAAPDEVLQPTRGANDDLTALRELLQLWHRVRATIDRDDPELGAKTQLFRFHCDLLAQLARGGHDDARRGHGALLQGHDASAECLCDAGHKERGRFPTASLGRHHHIRSLQRCGHGVLLHGRRYVVPTAFDVKDELRRDVVLVATILERLCWQLHATAASSLDRYIIVRVEVDPSNTPEAIPEDEHFLPTPISVVAGRHSGSHQPPLVGEKRTGLLLAL
mmetsp:Transcript_113860/g.322023  ORF Transcript_113860/g.322023 Transcript_113860/m.322023 type:complete len:253 (-) Transcript_113860:431-1189(-)